MRRIFTTVQCAGVAFLAAGAAMSLRAEPPAAADVVSALTTAGVDTTAQQQAQLFSALRYVPAKDMDIVVAGRGIDKIFKGFVSQTDFPGIEGGSCPVGDVAFVMEKGTLGDIMRIYAETQGMVAAESTLRATMAWRLALEGTRERLQKEHGHKLVSLVTGLKINPIYLVITPAEKDALRGIYEGWCDRLTELASEVGAQADGGSKGDTGVRTYRGIPYTALVGQKLLECWEEGVNVPLDRTLAEKKIDVHLEYTREGVILVGICGNEQTLNFAKNAGESILQKLPEAWPVAPGWAGEPVFVYNMRKDCAAAYSEAGCSLYTVLLDVYRNIFADAAKIAQQQGAPEKKDVFDSASRGAEVLRDAVGKLVKLALPTDPTDASSAIAMLISYKKGSGVLVQSVAPGTPEVSTAIGSGQQLRDLQLADDPDCLVYSECSTRSEVARDFPDAGDLLDAGLQFARGYCAITNSSCAESTLAKIAPAMQDAVKDIKGISDSLGNGSATLAVFLGDPQQKFPLRAAVRAQVKNRAALAASWQGLVATLRKGITAAGGDAEHLISYLAAKESKLRDGDGATCYTLQHPALRAVLGEPQVVLTNSQIILSNGGSVSDKMRNSAGKAYPFSGAVFMLNISRALQQYGGDDGAFPKRIYYVSFLVGKERHENIFLDVRK